MYEDKTLTCKECGKEFVFTAGEQEFYAEKGFSNEPQRCKECRDARKNATRGERKLYETTCQRCGGVARVPFDPSKIRGDKEILCSEYTEGKSGLSKTLNVYIVSTVNTVNINYGNIDF